MHVINQKEYLEIEIDASEPDIIQLWQFGLDDGNVIMIERDQLQELIELLKTLVDAKP